MTDNAPTAHAVIGLDERQSAIRERARAFAEEVVAPVAAERDRIQDPLEAFPWDVWREGARRGIRTLPTTVEHGGAGMDVLGHCAALEEICAADCGVGLAYHQTWKLQQRLVQTEYLREEILPAFLADDDYLLTLAMTEPGAGTDNVHPYRGADGGSQTRAEQQPDGDWVINGTKHFMTNGGIGKGGFVICRTDPSKPVSEGATAFFVKHDTPGFRFGKVHDKMGWRLVPNAELIYEDVRIPDAARVSEVGEGLAWLGSLGGLNAAATAVYGIGTARKALDLTIARVRERIQGGRPIGEHQAVQLKLGDMWADVETARTLTWRAAWSAEYNPSHDRKLGPLAQLFSAEMSVRVCYNAMQLWGGLGYMRDAPIEKLMRDALGNYHADGLNDGNRMRIAQALLGDSPKGYLI